MKNLIFIVEFKIINGGMCQSVLSLIDGLSQLPNYNITLVTPQNSELLKYPFKSKVNLIDSKKNWTIGKYSIFKMFNIARKIVRELNLKTSKQTVFISNNVGASILLSFIKIFTHVNELYVNRGGNFSGKSLGTMIMRHKLTKHKIKAIITTSNKQSQVISEIIDDNLPLVLIPNGLPSPIEEYSFKPIPSDKLIIGSIGFISDIKNYIEGVKLIKILREKQLNAHLNIYGSVSSKSDKIYYEKLITIIQELNLEPFIHFKGFVEGEEKFKESDLIISFSKTEGFGRSLVESMLRKKPVIAWRGAGGPVDITDNGNAGFLVDNNEAIEYAELIQSLIENPEKLEENVNKAFCRAKNKYTNEIMVKNYNYFFEQFYDSLI